MANIDEQRLIKPTSQRQFELYALSLERGPNFEPSHIFSAYQVGRGSACGCILLDPERGAFTTLAMRRRVDHLWVRVDQCGPFSTPETALDHLSISMHGGEPPEPLPPGARRRPPLMQAGARGVSPEFELLAGTVSHVPALVAVGECYLALPKPDANFVTDLQTNNFASRLFELYLLACFREQGLIVRQDHVSPDFWIEKDGADCWIEAVTANSETPRAGGIGDWVHAPEDRNERLTGAPAERFAKTLRGKLQRNYHEMDHVKGRSFAIGERVRDKIAASKRKGIWVGGPVPLGYRSVDKALVIVPEDAETVRTIFARYLAVGSIRLLVEDLHQSGIYPRGRIGADLGQGEAQRTVEPRRFMVGPLGHILKNQFYIGDVAYRGEVHPGQHAAIIDRATFAAVQERLRAATVARTESRSGSTRLLTGLLYDEEGNRMSPSHACKKGVRYRYYVSQALQQNRPVDAGTVTRVSAPDIEALVVAAVRGYLRENDSEEGSMTAVAPPRIDLPDRDVIAGHVVRVVPGPRQVEIILRGPDADSAPPQALIVPWAPRRGRVGKGIASEPSGAERLDPQTREVLLTAIGKARLWIDDLMEGRVGSIDEIAEREGKGERHIRLLMPLAFVSPRIVGAIVDGTAPAGLTVTALARALPHGWSEQARQLGIA